MSVSSSVRLASSPLATTSVAAERSPVAPARRSMSVKLHRARMVARVLMESPPSSVRVRLATLVKCVT